MPRKKQPPTVSEPRPGYSFSDVLARTSATKSNLLHWANIKIITPAVEDTAGSGYPRRFSLENLVEVELCAAVNQFRVPATLIADAAQTFRQFHRRNLALTEHGPTDSDTFTPAQRDAYLAALTAEATSPDRKKKGLAVRRPDMGRLAAVLLEAISNEKAQRHALKDAAGWERYRRDQAFRKRYFCGLFVLPMRMAPDRAPVGETSFIWQDWTAPAEMNWLVSYDAIVINLGRVLTRIERYTGGQL